MKLTNQRRRTARQRRDDPTRWNSGSLYSNRRAFPALRLQWWHVRTGSTPMLFSDGCASLPSLRFTRDKLTTPHISLVRDHRRSKRPLSLRRGVSIPQCRRCINIQVPMTTIAPPELGNRLEVWRKPAGQLHQFDIGLTLPPGG
jgi:hypothetical protein